MADRDREHEPALRPVALRADAVEGELVSRFTAHPVLAGIERLSPAVFVDVLLQRRFLSLMFPVVYDLGIDGLTDGRAIRLVREILREEYPDPSGRTPSHREDLVADLLALGVSRERIIGARPTPATATAIERTLALIAGAAPGDLELMTILRFWGEVLVSVEYGEYWRRMEARFAAAGTTSRFYHPHHHHDGRDPLATAGAAARTHAGRLGACLVRLLGAPDGVERFATTERRVLALRLEFYDQF
jgi:hypothetical protein